MIKARFALLTLFFILFSLPAFAQEEGFYVAGSYGALLLNESDGEKPSGDFVVDFDTGNALTFALGYDFGTKHPDIGVGRLELELALREIPLKETDFTGALATAEGDLEVRSLMLNSFGESRDNLPWIPYVGLGVGVAEVRLENATTGGAPFVDDSDLVFAFQAGAGVGFMVSDPLTIDFGYRFLGMTKPELTAANGEKFELEHYSHLFLVGARITF
ncbi:outer membrane beta-barrel protein [Desulfuromonas sp. AOP6]|uniref:outer membrane protein n=1 Tax=Desulfuromonas sp. AOP6 TaxID=1566351 RepID=UPI00127CA016|nr:outer membrane beta-barrel protein [Desulfuromonas sp. AOP6]BCA78433.1 outer membrane channel protein [Desulfuromonas sp. AOP6]